MELSTGCDIHIFAKAGYDNSSLGTCYQSQRVLMLAEIKFKGGKMPEYDKKLVNISKPPKEFKELGLHLRVPALYLSIKDFEPIDIADDIVIELENRYPGALLKDDLEAEAEIVTRDFFSKFCHWMRGVAKDGSHLEVELANIDHHLASVTAALPEDGKLFLCGSRPAQIDCEVLPKLHQVRVAAEGIKGYEFPRRLIYLWRYLHSAYSEDAFTASCPCDSEILLHWLDTGTGRLTPRQQQLIAATAGRPPTTSLTVPATAVPAIIE